MEREKPQGREKYLRKISAPGLLIAVAANFDAEPRFGVSPVAISSCVRNAKCPGGLAQGEAGKITKLDQFGLAGIDFGEPFEGFVESQQINVGLRGLDLAWVDVDPLKLAPRFAALLMAGLIHEDAAHGLGSGGEEMAAAVPFRSQWHGTRRHCLVAVTGRLTSGPPPGTHEPQKRLMYQRGSLEGLAWLFRAEFGGGETSQLAVYKR
jgi:hypothetical protein